MEMFNLMLMTITLLELGCMLLGMMIVLVKYTRRDKK